MAKPVPPMKAAPAKKPDAGKSRLPAKSGPARGGGSQVLGLIVTGAAMLALSVVAAPIAVLLVAGMIPTIVAYIVDRTPWRTLTLTVGPLNLAGTAPYCLLLWFGTDTIQALGQYLGNVWVWLIMYLAAGIGWLLHLGMPLIVRIVLEGALDRRKGRLLQLQSELRADWGAAVDAGADHTSPA
jgi:hypothetical protein